MEVNNKTLTSLLSGMVSKSFRDWDTELYHAEFAYNRTPSYAISHFPFEVCFGFSPFTPLDLILISQESKATFDAEARVKDMKKLHEQVRAQTKNVNEQYNSKANKNCTDLEFKLGDLVWIYLFLQEERTSLWLEEMTLTRLYKRWQKTPTK